MLAKCLRRFVATAALRAQASQASHPDSARPLVMISAAAGVPARYRQVVAPAVLPDFHRRYLAPGFGEDACFALRHAAGVADGVSGWANDPNADSAKFAKLLMHKCLSLLLKSVGEDSAVGNDNDDDSYQYVPMLLQEARFATTFPSSPAAMSDKIVQRVVREVQRAGNPVEALAAAYYSIVNSPNALVGGCTVCVGMIQGDTLTVANIGDSAFVVIRDGKTIIKSRRESTVADARIPRQLSSSKNVDPRSATIYTTNIQKGDLVLFASDGVWDNVFVQEIEAFALKSYSSSPNPLPAFIRTIVDKARERAVDRRCDSPFSIRLSEQETFPYSGGRDDDITVVACEVVDAVDHGATRLP